MGGVSAGVGRGWKGGWKAPRPVSFQPFFALSLPTPTNPRKCVVGRGWKGAWKGLEGGHAVPFLTILFLCFEAGSPGSGAFSILPFANREFIASLSAPLPMPKLRLSSENIFGA
jgi:hypothetical protein